MGCLLLVNRVERSTELVYGMKFELRAEDQVICVRAPMNGVNQTHVVLCWTAPRCQHARRR